MVLAHGTPVRINRKSGYINKTGELAIPAQYGGAQPFSEGMAAVSIGIRGGYIDKTRKLLIPTEFTETLPFKNGLALIGIDGKLGHILIGWEDTFGSHRSE